MSVAVDVGVAAVAWLGVGTGVRVAVAVAVEVLVAPPETGFNTKAASVDPAGTKICPAPEPGAANGWGVWARLWENSCAPLVGSNPRSSCWPRSRFHSTPPEMIGGLDA